MELGKTYFLDIRSSRCVVAMGPCYYKCAFTDMCVYFVGVTCTIYNTRDCAITKTDAESRPLKYPGLEEFKDTDWERFNDNIRSLRCKW